MKEKVIWLVIGFGVFSGCTITKNVQSVPYKLRSICLERNDDTFMSEYHGVLERNLSSLGMQTRSIWPNEEKDCETFMKYHAEWTWDLAMYLSDATFSVYKGQDQIGYAEYDSGRFSFRPDKFGKTENIIRPMLRELFKNQ